MCIAIYILWLCNNIINDWITVFRVTFKKKTYVHDNKNYGELPELCLIYPEELDDSVNIFPISVYIYAKDITATGKLQIMILLNVLAWNNCQYTNYIDSICNFAYVLIKYAYVYIDIYWLNFIIEIYAKIYKLYQNII